MKFSGKMCLKIVLKVTKSQGFTLSLEDTFLEKPKGVVKLTPSLLAILGLTEIFKKDFRTHLFKKKITALT